MSLLDPASLLVAWERGRAEPALDRALTLLAVDTGRSVQEAAALDVGSRDARLATVLVRIVGSTAWAAVECGSCGERLDVPVDIAAVARFPAHEPGEVFQTRVGDSTVSFRLPTTADLAALPPEDPVAARRSLLDRCIGCTGDELPDLVGQAVEAAMEVVAPGGAVDVAVRCTGCGAETAAVLDVPALLWAEVEAEAAALVEDVHALAAAYGWSEAEVLRLSARRRAAYLELVRG
ncbi:hypothetical protein GCM10027451_15900 [Geodermatophilus aquaeductus]|uniref:Phage baseplate protein n=1 Tax=Geodermatophilus aquaeductus TaxID=1564161 RepID=A0A521DXV4_9ACTN|nr:hypothetical protein [Geodermatophilus aquaeductus]SMO76506.1 hypothetical protein SAMN06273567_10410 [Geodermatophilus aquaeductus]